MLLCISISPHSLILHSSHFIYIIDSPQYYKDQCSGRDEEVFVSCAFSGYLLSTYYVYMYCAGHWALTKLISEGKRKSST